MQDKIKTYLKRLSFVSGHPQTDWQKLFLVFIFLGLVSLAWNIYFFFSVRSEIEASDRAASSAEGRLSTEQEDKLRKVIESYEAKKARNAEILQKGVPALEDPASA